MIKIRAVGDLMPGGILNKKDTPFVSQDIIDCLDDADIRVGTLECAIGNEPIFNPIKRSKGSSAFVYAEDSDLARLLKLNINVVSLANNHFFDLGEIGAKHTMQLLDDSGILHCGAGINLSEAQKPAVVNVNGKQIAFIGFCDKVDKYCQFATSDTPGVNPLEEGNIISCIEDAKKQYDYIFALVHWGKEHTWWPRPHVISYARLLYRSGVSGIIGGHPHRVQSIGRIRNCPIAYSLGNFLFPDRIINTPYVTYYPSDMDAIKDMRCVCGFTRVQEPSLKLWPDIANIGMILEISCMSQTQVKFDYRLTQINRIGFVDFLKKTQRTILILTITKYIISCPLYRFLMQFCDLFEMGVFKCRNLIKRIYKRVFLINRN